MLPPLLAAKKGGPSDLGQEERSPGRGPQGAHHPHKINPGEKINRFREVETECHSLVAYLKWHILHKIVKGIPYVNGFPYTAMV